MCAGPVFSLVFLSQSCSVFLSCDISTVTVLIRGSRELPFFGVWQFAKEHVSDHRHALHYHSILTRGQHNASRVKTAIGFWYTSLFAVLSCPPGEGSIVRCVLIAPAVPEEPEEQRVDLLQVISEPHLRCSDSCLNFHHFDIQSTAQTLGNQLQDGSVCLSPLSPIFSNGLHVSIATLPRFLLTSSVHHLSGPDKTKKTQHTSTQMHTYICTQIHYTHIETQKDAPLHVHIKVRYHKSSMTQQHSEWKCDACKQATTHAHAQSLCM